MKSEDESPLKNHARSASNSQPPRGLRSSPTPTCAAIQITYSPSYTTLKYTTGENHALNFQTAALTGLRFPAIYRVSTSFHTPLHPLLPTFPPGRSKPSRPMRAEKIHTPPNRKTKNQIPKLPSLYINQGGRGELKPSGNGKLCRGRPLPSSPSTSRRSTPPRVPYSHNPTPPELHYQHATSTAH